MPTNRSIAYTTQIVHVGSGGALAAGAMSAATDVSVALDSTNLLRWPLADVALKISNTGSISSASNTILLYRRDLNFDGTNDEPTPATTASIAYSNHLVGVFQFPAYTAATAATYQSVADVPLSDQCEFYIENKLNTGVGAGWTLKVTPKTDSYS